MSDEANKETGDRRTGKVARLTKEWRDVVCLMLRDGAEYKAIIHELEEHGFPGVSAQNLTNWKDGGYQDWLREQGRLDDMRMKREFAMQVVKENEGSKIHEAAQQIAASQIYEVLTDLDPASISEKLKGNPEQYARLINALAKLSDEGLKYQRYKDEVAKHKAEIEKQLQAGQGGGLTKEAIAVIQKELNLL